MNLPTPVMPEIPEGAALIPVHRLEQERRSGFRTPDEPRRVVAYGLVDAQDLPRLTSPGTLWYGLLDPYGELSYIYRTDHRSGRSVPVLLHNQVMGGDPPPGYTWDHKNRRPWDCRRGNLRPATRVQQSANQGPRRDSKTGLKGVRRDPKRRDRFTAHIKMNYTPYDLGSFSSTWEAAFAYNVAASILHGVEFGYQNAIPDHEIPSPERQQEIRLRVLAKLGRSAETGDRDGGLPG